MANIHIDTNEAEETDTAIHCNILQHSTAHCSTLQHTAAHCHALQRTATHCNALQHTTTHCNTLQHTATLRDASQTTYTNKTEETQISWVDGQVERRHLSQRYLHVKTTHSYVRTEIIYTCGHDSFIRVDMTHSYVWT